MESNDDVTFCATVDFFTVVFLFLIPLSTKPPKREEDDDGREQLPLMTTRRLAKTSSSQKKPSFSLSLFKNKQLFRELFFVQILADFRKEAVFFCFVRNEILLY